MIVSKRRRLNNGSTLNIQPNQLNLIITRVRVLQLVEIGWTNVKISNYLNISTATIIKYKKKCNFDDNNSFLDDKRSGRPVSINEQKKKEILNESKNLGFSPRKYVLSRNNQISRSTVRNVLKNNNLHPYRLKKASRIQDWHISARLSWCKQYVKKSLQYWENILITDSKIFRLDGGYNPQNQRQYLPPEQKHNVLIHDKDKISPGIHYYGGLSHLGLTELVRVEGNVTSKMYIEKILPKLLFKHQKRRKKDGLATEVMLFDDPTSFIFEQDHASVHDSNKTQEWLLHQGINYLTADDTPSKLDDVWAIERVWAIMTQQVYIHPMPKTLEELDKRVKLCWKNFNRKSLKKLIHEIPHRLKEIIKRKGEKIHKSTTHCKCDFCE